MALIETIFLPENTNDGPFIKLESIFECTESKNIAEHEKIGHIYRTAPDKLLFECCHCAEKFPLFIQFSAHIQTHLLQIHTDSIELLPKEELQPPKEEPHQPNDAVVDLKFTEYVDSDSKDYSDDVRCEFSTDDEDVTAFTAATISSTATTSRVAQLKYNTHDMKCSICNRSFNNANSLKRHKATHILEKPYSCSICDMKFSGKPSMRKHMMKIHNQSDFQNNENYHCEQCNKNFSKKTTFEKHVKAHSSHPAWDDVNQSYECYECHDKFESITTCRDHLSLHWSFVFECGRCTVKFQKESAYRRHVKLCGNTNESVPCDRCSESFASRKLLRHHINTVHAPAKSAHSEPQIRSCKLCPKQFLCKFELRKHMRWHRKQTNVKPYECQICGYKCLEKAMRDRHVARHLGGMKFTCDICHGTFDLERRKQHMQSHTGERNHQCAECGRLFMTKINLRSHMLSHTEERNYRCDLCPKVYKRSSKLSQHRRSHLVDFVYKCKFCSQGFKAKISLVKHSLSIHAKPWNAEIEES